MRPAPMRPGQRMAWRGTQTLRPKNRRRIEHEVAFRPGVNRGCPVLRPIATNPSRSASDDFQTSDVRRLPVILPADETRNPIARS